MLKNKPTLLIALSLFVSLTNGFTPVEAETLPINVDATPPKPPTTVTPTGREPAGSRGPCGEDKDALFTPLLPVTGSLADSKFYGKTLSGNPSFWFYISYKNGSVSEGKFSLEDIDGNTIYETALKIPKTPGFISVSMPAEEKPLERNKQYRWKFIVYCVAEDPADNSQSVWHTGLVERVDMPDLETQVKAATVEERINLYIDKGILYDAATDVATIRNITKPWLNLLQVIGLPELKQTIENSQNTNYVTAPTKRLK